MSKKTKRGKLIDELFKGDRVYCLDDALAMLSRYSQVCKAKFDETVEVVCKLGVDPRQSDQIVRGSVVMPSGIGRDVKVAVFVKKERINEAIAAGADFAGEEELVESVRGGNINFDVCIATPDMMPKIAVLGKVLGPRGMMPNVKLGTVSDDVKEAVVRVKSGQVEYKVEKAGLVHAGIGKLSFASDALKVNFLAFYNAVLSAKPSASKGVYMQKIFLSVTQGPGIELDLRDVMN